MKYYFQKNDEDCFPLGYHYEHMTENELTEMEVFEAKVERGTGMFFCKEFREIGEVGESCGKRCARYSPRNGKSGICKYYGYVYEQSKSRILKLKP